MKLAYPEKIQGVDYQVINDPAVGVFVKGLTFTPYQPRVDFFKDQGDIQESMDQALAEQRRKYPSFTEFLDAQVKQASEDPDVKQEGLAQESLWKDDCVASVTAAAVSMKQSGAMSMLSKGEPPAHQDPVPETPPERPSGTPDPVEPTDNPSEG